MSTSVQKVIPLRKSVALASGIARGVHGRRVPHNLRGLVATASFHTALEHHRAILELVRRRWYGSAFALARPLYESCIVGLWANLLATDAQIQDFNARRYRPKPDRVLKALRRHGESGYLSMLTAMYRAGHQALDEFVHGGLSQVTRRVVGGDIRSNYPAELVSSLLEVANVLVAISATQMADITQNGEESKNLTNAIDRYFA